MAVRLRPTTLRRSTIIAGTGAMLAIVVSGVPSRWFSSNRTPDTRALFSARTRGGGRGAMPPANPPGWIRVFADDFNERSMAADHNWSRYYGQPAGDAAGWWDPSHDTIADGQLKLRGFRDDVVAARGEPRDTYVTGGVSLYPAQSGGQRYGKYLVRFRMDPGQGIAGVLLLWPTNHRWPPEIDFSEDNGAAPRSRLYANLHYGTYNQLLSRETTVDLSQWHTLGVEWSIGKLAYTIDGRTWAVVRGPQVPSVAMTLDMQTQAWGCGRSWETCPNKATPHETDMDINWVVVYRRAAPG